MALKTSQLKITDAEYESRCNRLQEIIAELGASGIVLFDADYVKYYTGFAFIPTERPMAFIMRSRHKSRRRSPTGRPEQR